MSQQIPYGYVPPATVTTLPANPTAPASTSAYKMQGLAQLITPAAPSANVLAIFMATLTDSATTVGEGINMQVWYGPVVSGVAPPANGAAIPQGATQLCATFSWESGVTLTTAADSLIPVTLAGLAKGLTSGQQYWFDIAAESITTASDVALTNVTAILAEIS
jgi:peptidoglycan hydrolase-like protein with peptidoglycan-binding domain